MYELIIMMAKLTPKEINLQNLIEGAKEYLINPSEENERKLVVELLICFVAFEPGDKNPIDMIKDFNEHKKWQDLNPKNHQS